MMRTWKTCLRWGALIAGVGLVIAVVVAAGLLTGFMIPPVWAPGLWRVPFGLLTLASLCVVAGLVLLIIAVNLRAKR